VGLSVEELEAPWRAAEERPAPNMRNTCVR
jgi:hypothetical protein